MKKSKIWTPPHKVWKIVEAAENLRSESTYSSALEKLSAYGRGVTGAMALWNLGNKLMYLVIWSNCVRVEARRRCCISSWHGAMLKISFNVRVARFRGKILAMYYHVISSYHAQRQSFGLLQRYSTVGGRKRQNSKRWILHGMSSELLARKLSKVISHWIHTKYWFKEWRCGRSLFEWYRSKSLHILQWAVPPTQ